MHRIDFIQQNTKLTKAIVLDTFSKKIIKNNFLKVIQFYFSLYTFQ